MSIFSDRLKELRHKHKITQAQLAAAIGTTDRACRRYEAGENEPTMSVLQAMADYFDVSVDYLIGRTNYWQDPEGHITAKIPPDIFSDEEKQRIIKRSSKPR